MKIKFEAYCIENGHTKILYGIIEEEDLEEAALRKLKYESSTDKKINVSSILFTDVTGL